MYNLVKPALVKKSKPKPDLALARSKSLMEGGRDLSLIQPILIEDDVQSVHEIETSTKHASSLDHSPDKINRKEQFDIDLELDGELTPIRSHEADTDDILKEQPEQKAPEFDPSIYLV